jgi:hypothetical protein
MKVYNTINEMSKISESDSNAYSTMKMCLWFINMVAWVYYQAVIHIISTTVDSLALPTLGSFLLAVSINDYWLREKSTCSKKLKIRNECSRKPKGTINNLLRKIIHLQR